MNRPSGRAANPRAKYILITRKATCYCPAISESEPNINQLARSLFSDYVFAFEVTSILLIIAVIATVILARRPFRNAPPREADQPRASGADEVRSR